MNKIRRYPFVKQRDEKDCAVACLAMILKYYNGNIPYDMLYDMLECSRKGTSAYNLVHVAEDIGFMATGVSCCVKDISQDILPCIAHVLLDKKYYHYIVIYKIDWAHKKMIIADPSNCIMTISIEQFELIFNKILITLYPVKAIPHYEKHNIVKKYFGIFIKMHKKNITLFVLYSIFVLLFSLVSSLSLLVLLTNSVLLTSKIYILYFIFIYIFKNFFLFLKESKIARIIGSINRKIAMDTFRNIIFLPYQVYCNRSTGEIASRLADSTRASEIIGTYIMCFSMDILLLVCVLLLLLKLSFARTIGLLFLCFLYFILYCQFDKKYSKVFASVKRKSGDMNHKLIESIAGFETIQGLNSQSEIVATIQKDYYAYSKHVNKLEKKRTMQVTIGTFLEDVISLWMVVMGIYTLKQGVFSLEKFLLFYSLSSYIIMPIKDLARFIHDKKELQEILDRIQDFNWNYKDKGGKICECIQTLECKSLNIERNDFKIPKFNCILYRGDKIFVYGKSGGGKSTFLKILKGYYSSYCGNIYMNQKNINEYDKTELQKNIVYVSQQETLFTNTLYENLCMGKRMDMQQIEHILEITKVNEILEHRHIGLNTLIEENGCNFSGGERQRIILARTLLQKAQVYLFDESFSEMDANMERIILKNIMNLYPEKIMIVVSHRLDNQDLFNGHIYVKYNQTIFQRKSCQERRIICLDG